MKNRYIDLINQTFDWPQCGFEVNESGELLLHEINLKFLIDKFGTPLRVTYLPKISSQIQNARILFNVAMAKVQYQGEYHYCYCTKSSHFSFVLNEVLKNDVHIETSSAFDIEIVKHLLDEKKIKKDDYIICNGFKRESYIQNVADLINLGCENTIPILDNLTELDELEPKLEKRAKVGIRIASEEEPNFNFYTSRLGIRYNDIVPYYLERIKDNENVELKMLHFFINNGIKDNAYYWNELMKSVTVYCELKKVCPSLDSLNIGGGFPFHNSLGFDYDYAYMAEEIIAQIKATCDRNGVPEPHIFTEFGTYTVAESGMIMFKILNQKKQNDRERWNMIDSSFLTTLPDTWTINQRFVMLPVNNWNSVYERVNLGGLTCDSGDFYDFEDHFNAIFLPQYKKNTNQYVGFFHTGAYQESVGGYGGIQHCLIPCPRHVVIEERDGKITTSLFAEEQTPESMLKILGY